MNGTSTITINSEPPKPTTFEDLGYIQVVRCKDCKYNDEGECIIKAGWFPVKPDWYCADGERNNGRTNEQRTVCPEIEGDRYTCFYVCGDCHGQVNWHDEVCRHCKARLDWNG